MDLAVNLATQPYIDTRPIVRGLRIGMVSLGALIVVVGSAAPFVHRRAQEARERSHAATARLDNLQREQGAYQSLMHSSHVLQVAARTAELNQILDAKAFSWTAVMQDLETVLPGKVQVTAMEPMRTKDGSTSLHLRVVGPHEKSVDLLRNLESSKRFLQPRIIGESLANNQGFGQKSVAVDPSTMMEFDLIVEYDGSSEDLPVSSTPKETSSQQVVGAHNDSGAQGVRTAFHKESHVRPGGAR